MAEIVGLYAPEVLPDHQWLCRAVLYQDKVSTVTTSYDPLAERLRSQLGERYVTTDFTAMLDSQNGPISEFLDWPSFLEPMQAYMANRSSKCNQVERDWAESLELGREMEVPSEALQNLRHRILTGVPHHRGDELDFIWEGKGATPLLEESGLVRVPNPMLDTAPVDGVHFVSDPFIFVGPTQVVANIFQQLTTIHCAESTERFFDDEVPEASSRWILSTSTLGQSLIEPELAAAYETSSHLQDSVESDALAQVLARLPIPNPPHDASLDEQIDFLVSFREDREFAFALLRKHLFEITLDDYSKDKIREFEECIEEILAFSPYGVSSFLTETWGSLAADAQALAIDAAVVSAISGLAFGVTAALGALNPAALAFGLVPVALRAVKRASTKAWKTHERRGELLSGPLGCMFDVASTGYTR